MIFLSDPYSVGGAISHCNDWLVLLPVFKDGRLVAYTSMFGHQSDIGGKVPGSMPIDATSIFQEGVRIPPVKIWKKGEYNEELVKLVLHQVRTPDWCKADLNALIASCRVAARRVLELCERFGDDVYASATDLLLARNYRAMKQLIETRSARSTSASRTMSATTAWVSDPTRSNARCGARTGRSCSISPGPIRSPKHRSTFSSMKT